MTQVRYAGRRTVYDKKTGEAISLEPVDARERIDCGLATAEPMPAKPEKKPQPVAGEKA